MGADIQPSGPPRRRGRTPRLSATQIAGVALDIVDEEGLEALSMARLAAELGVGTMTLYGYFRSKDELLDAVIDAAVATGEPPRRTTGWRSELRETVAAAHRTLTRHPALVQIRFQRPVLRPEALRFGERVMSILMGAGFDPHEASAAFRLIFTYTFGFAGLSPQRRALETRREAASAIARLPSDRYPALTTNAAAFADAMAGQALFEYGLDRIIDGLEARLADR